MGTVHSRILPGDPWWVLAEQMSQDLVQSGHWALCSSMPPASRTNHQPCHNNGNILPVEDLGPSPVSNALQAINTHKVLCRQLCFPDDNAQAGAAGMLTGLQVGAQISGASVVLPATQVPPPWEPGFDLALCLDIFYPHTPTQTHFPIVSWKF